MKALEVEGLRKTFVRGLFRQRTEAVSGISFNVERGEIFGFLGPNGAGKTTTIKILMGLIFPSNGVARVLGLPAGARAAKARVGYLPENPYFYDYLTAYELLDLVGRLHGQGRSERRRRGGELIERVGLTHAGKRPLRSYSKGMLQRAGLAQALMADPEVVVLDEPMSGLDPLGRKEVRELILEQRQRGKTVFFSTHILGDASLMCDRVGIIVRGSLRDVGPLGQLLDPAVHGVDVVWAAGEGENPDEIAKFGGVHEHTSEGWIHRAPDPARAQAFIRHAMDHGGRILDVTAHRQSLEELFVSQAEKSGGERR